MPDLWNVHYSGNSFKMFSAIHLLALFLILFFNIIMIKFLNKKKSDNFKRWFRYILAAIILLQQILYTVWHISNGIWSIQYSLPLHFCSISIFLAVLMLITKNYSLFELTYFVGLAASIQALLTPHLYNYNFPHFRFFEFFIAHGGIVTAVSYIVFVEKYRPRWKSIFKTFGFVNIYILFIILLNIVLKTNYLNIIRKPELPSIMDYLGPWPFYLFAIELVIVLSFILIYLPFFMSDTFKAFKPKKV